MCSGGDEPVTSTIDTDSTDDLANAVNCTYEASYILATPEGWETPTSVSAGALLNSIGLTEVADPSCDVDIVTH